VTARVLLVDDEPVIHELVAAVLGDAQLLSAATLAEARALAAAHPEIEVALIDKNLPDGTGLALVRELRDRGRDCELIVLTGYPSMDSVLEALNAGASDYLVKPLRDIHELRHRVTQAYDRVAGRRNERRLLAALRASEARYRRLFEVTPDAVLVLDEASGAIVDANPAAEALYQRTCDELRALPPGAWRAPNDLPETCGGLILRRDLRADGSLAVVEVACGTLAGEPPLAVDVVRDVSSRVELEARLARAARLEAVGQLASGVAHDFNNALCVIVGACEYAGDALAAGAHDEVAPELDRIKEAVRNAANLTRELLVFGRRQIQSPELMDLRVRIGAVCDLLDRTLGANVTLVRDFSAPAVVRTGSGQLEHVITNLVVNARDALAQAGGTITIATRRRPNDEGSRGVAITVSDTGPGIPPELAERVFEPFFTTKGERGTGLGLANAREMIERAGGTINLTTTAPRSACFTIWLPVVDEAAPVVHRRAPTERGAGESVLLVEDDAAVRDVAQRALQGAGYAVHGVRDAETALAFVADGGRADVLVADIELPGMSGVECARRVGDALGIVLTCGAAPDPRHGPLPDAAVLSKPYALADLLRSVRRALEARP
jgi:PAS domain S-box-containing protein